MAKQIKKKEEIEKVEETKPIKEKVKKEPKTNKVETNSEVVTPPEEKVFITENKEVETSPENTSVYFKEVELTIKEKLPELEDEVLTHTSTTTCSTTMFVPQNGETKLSYMAMQYKKYIEYLKMTPESFKEKYPKHKFISVVDEILEWEVKTNNGLNI